MHSRPIFLIMPVAILLTAHSAFGDACCLFSGDCQDMTPDECTAADGYLFGVGVDCSQAECEPQGACPYILGGDALGSGPATEFGCDFSGGAYLGDCLGCDSYFDQEDEPGACCRPDGTCFIENNLGCNAAGGIYQGEGIPCEAVNCASTGACCSVDECGATCETVVAAACQQTNQRFLGVNTSCDSTNCDIEFATNGSCCSLLGDCAVISEFDCLRLGGTFDGNDQNCSSLCPQLIGSCYLPEGGCQIRRFIDCIEGVNGRFVFLLPFIQEVCRPLDFDQLNPTPRGYCCIESNFVRDRLMSRDECFRLGGTIDTFVMSLDECTAEILTTPCVETPESSCPFTILPMLGVAGAAVLPIRQRERSRKR